MSHLIAALRQSGKHWDCRLGGDGLFPLDAFKKLFATTQAFGVVGFGRVRRGVSALSEPGYQADSSSYGLTPRRAVTVTHLGIAVYDGACVFGS
jgi:hypothetical protein